MENVTLILSKTILIFCGIIIIIISKNFSFSFLLPTKNKFVILDKNQYLKTIQKNIKLLGILFIIIGLISFFNTIIYYFTIPAIILLNINMNKELKKFYYKQ